MNASNNSTHLTKSRNSSYFAWQWPGSPDLRPPGPPVLTPIMSSNILGGGLSLPGRLRTYNALSRGSRIVQFKSQVAGNRFSSPGKIFSKNYRRTLKNLKMIHQSTSIHLYDSFQGYYESSQREVAQ